MGTALVVISGLGIFFSIGVFVVSLILKIIFSIAKKEEKAKKASKAVIISAIAFCVFLIAFIVTMIVAPKLDPVGWCSHEYSVVERQDSTCTKNGYIKKVCPNCNDEVVEYIDAYHFWIEEIISEATCTSQKQVKKICTRCKATEYEKVGDLLNHSWIKDSIIIATCSHPKQLINKCSVCGTIETIEEGSPIPHSFGDWSVSIEPTTEKEGQKSRICSVCQYIENSNIPAIDYIEVTANELWSAFDENEVNAEQAYNGKKVRITGVISDINSSGAFVDANVLLLVDGSYFGCVQCNFGSKNVDMLSTLHKGDSVTIEGTCGTLSLYNVIVRNCKVVEQL